jgi:hypothetical protein
MPDKPPPTPEFRYQDRPDLNETFADSVGRWTFDGNTLRMEFTVARLDDRKPSETPTGTRVPVCRLVLSTAGALELLTQTTQLAATLEKAGMIKKTSEASATKVN